MTFPPNFPPDGSRALLPSHDRDLDLAHLWRPRPFSTARDCLSPLLSDPLLYRWLTQLFDPRQSPIDPRHFSLAFQSSRGTSADFYAIQSVALPCYIDAEQGVACLLNLGHLALKSRGLGAEKEEEDEGKDESGAGAILSRTTVIAFKFYNLIFDCTHYADGTAVFMYSFNDEFGSRHVYTFHLIKTSSSPHGDLDLDHPLSSMYEVGKPHCHYCDFFHGVCQCPYDEAERAKVLISTKPCGSFDNVVTMFSQTKSSEARIYNTEGKLVAVQMPQQRTFTRISVWDSIGPRILQGVLPIRADLVMDHLNSLSPGFISNIRRLLIPQEDSIPSIKYLEHQVIGTPTIQEIHNDRLSRQDLWNNSTGTSPELHHHHVQDTVHLNDNQHQSIRLGTIIPMELPWSTEFFGAAEDKAEEKSGHLQSRPDPTGSHRSLPYSHISQATQGPTTGHKVLRRPDTNTHIWASRMVHDCPHCGKRLSSKSNMVKHVKTVHEKIKVSSCGICGLQFAQFFNLQRHMIRQHKQHLADKHIMKITD